MTGSKSKLIFIGILVLVSSCTTDEDVIKRLDKYDFSSFKNQSIAYRSKGSSIGTSLFMLSSNTMNCSSYFVEVDNFSSKIVDVDNGLVIKSCEKDYFEDDEIMTSMVEFLKLEVNFLQVDSSGNVYINPGGQGGPTLLRIENELSKDDSDYFVHKKGRWYKRK